MSSYDPVGTQCLQLQQGTAALQSYLIREFGVTNLGTFVCRPVSGSTTLSLHAEGRAGDNGGKSSAMREVANLLVANADRLGVQEVIFERKIWRNNYQPLGWQAYTGADPHNSHVHWALNWAGAQTLTTELIDNIIGEQMPLSNDDLDRIAKLIDDAIVRRLGDVGERPDGTPRRKNISSAVVHAIEYMVAPDYLK